MESYVSLHAVNAAMQKAGVGIITQATLAALFPSTTRLARYAIIDRLERRELIHKIKKGVYEVAARPLSEFARAQILMPQSYISLESALNYYGILAQFPHMITSVTVGKTQRFEKEQTYAYTHIMPSLFHGYEKQKDFLIATKEKALIDMLYLVSKGLRTIDMSELDLSGVHIAELRKYPWSKQYAQ